MKKIILTLLAIQTINVYSQISTVTSSTEAVPEKSVKDIYIVNPMFNSGSFAVYVSSGLSKYIQNKEIRLIDSKTLTEIKKIDFPKYKGFDILSNYEHSVIGAKQNIIVFYKKSDEKNSDITNVYGIKLDESLTKPETPTYLFGAEDPQNRFGVLQYWNYVYQNDAKDLNLFAYIVQNKKKDIKTFYYRLFDNNLKLLKTDSVVGKYKTADTCSAFVYDNGVALIVKNALTLFNAKTNKTQKITLNTKEKTLYLGKIKTLANGKLILCGNYTTEIQGKLNGIFKITYNPVKQAIEEEIYNDHTPKGKFEKKTKIVTDVLITESGNCYVGFYQVSQQDELGYIEGRRKYEIMGISSKGEKWQKQLAVFDQEVTYVYLTLSNENLIVLYPTEDKKNNGIDYNNYEFGNPYPNDVVINRSISNSMLKVTPTGIITHQYTEDVSTFKQPVFIDNNIICIKTETANSGNTVKATVVKYTIIK